jgi:hypothetical protein
MARSLLRGLGHDRHIEASADYLSDLSSLYTLIGDSVISGSRGALLQHEPVKMGRIEPMHRGPAATTVAYIR